VAHWIARVEEVAGKLGRKKRAAFLGFYVKQLSYEELAERLNESRNNIGNLLHRARAAWRPRLPMRGFLGRTLGPSGLLARPVTAGDSGGEGRNEPCIEKRRGL